MKQMYKIAAFITALLMLFVSGSALAVDDGYSTSYTYNYDYWTEVRESPDAYRVEAVINSASLGLEKNIKRPQSLFVLNNDLYIVDTDNNRIIQTTRKDNEFKLVRIIDTLKGVEPATLSSPQDVYVDAKENIYIADTNNQRVVAVDKDLNYIKQFVKPTDATFDQNLSFLPSKIVCDVAGRLYALVTYVNKGLVKFEADTTFTGFIGANKVTTSMADYIWKAYFQTDAQRAQSEAFVPTEYANIYMDPDGFIYATTINFKEYDLLYDNAKPIRRLNGVGDDILVKNDRYPPIGDLTWESDSEAYGPSKLIDVTVLENDIYVAFDRTRGRLFGYDSQGIMLWAFGTKGSIQGAFTGAVSIEHMGRDLLCLDQRENSITVFTPTEYGNLIYQAVDEYTQGDYDKSAETWRQVMKNNSNYSMAFIGIGRSLMRQEKYTEAMEYFEMAHDRDNYGRAFKYYRKQWVEQNILWIVILIGAVVIIPLVIGKAKKMKWEVVMHEHKQVNK